MAVDGADVAEAKLLKQQAGDDDPLNSFFHLVTNLRHFRADAREALQKMIEPLMRRSVRRMAHNAIEIFGDCPDVLGDAPLIIIEDGNETLGCGLDVVEGLIRNAVGESRVTGDADHILIRLAMVTRCSHPEGRGKRRAGGASAKPVVGAFRTECEPHRAAGLSNLGESPATAGQKLVDVHLVADVPDKLVLGRVENAVQRDGQFDHAEIRREVAAGLAQHRDQFVTDFLCQRLQLLHREQLDTGRRIDHVKITSHARLLAYQNSFPLSSADSSSPLSTRSASNGSSAMLPSVFLVRISIFFSASSSFWLQKRTNRVPSSYFLRTSSSGNSASSISATICSSRWMADSNVSPFLVRTGSAPFFLPFILRQSGKIPQNRMRHQAPWLKS